MLGQQRFHHLEVAMNDGRKDPVAGQVVTREKSSGVAVSITSVRNNRAPHSAHKSKPPIEPGGTFWKQDSRN